MPRLPTMRVIGSQFISTTFPRAVLVSRVLVATSRSMVLILSPAKARLRAPVSVPFDLGRRIRQQARTLCAPAGLIVQGVLREAAQPLDERPIRFDQI